MMTGDTPLGVLHGGFDRGPSPSFGRADPRSHGPQLAQKPLRGRLPYVQAVESDGLGVSAIVLHGVG